MRNSVYVYGTVLCSDVTRMLESDVFTVRWPEESAPLKEHWEKVMALVTSIIADTTALKGIAWQISLP